MNLLDVLQSLYVTWCILSVPAMPGSERRVMCFVQVTLVVCIAVFSRQPSRSHTHS